ncbi:acetate kinase [Liquorilactobacillus sucicola DSM 21376 = JCM 15457]|uniref:Acetate kinase n=1 Tax=Liquorilactobacillus sucicola DSM 21376 = JCM 15457 TaxID=1423806 RepID=A0A023D0Q8_9LACO|nr:acetate kinase [Liquorilactobacillus sucicola]KRN06447.1 acetate kinase [Liquorilactobacillus sucicola DSM 21376 = JCM 15457]GAJ27421.1 acetate kinase [Liquorilactobacillus sucicola DSM 21376 = JCM 15457]
MIKILAVNAGSSTLKWKLFQMPRADVIAKGQIERIGFKDARLSITTMRDDFSEELTIKDHQQAVDKLLGILTEYKIVDKLDEIKGVGHRFVNGANHFAKSIVIDDTVLKEMEDLVEFAPLHNPANIMAIKAFRRELPNALSVAVFDTGFHQTIPEENVVYAIPYEYYQKFHVQKFGAHGISYRYVLQRFLKVTECNKENKRVIILHLGSGASVCAIQNGKSLDTSMGFSPVSGIAMQTRSGDVDPSMLIYLEEKLGVNSKSVLKMLNNKSGILGISGVSSDMREIMEIHQKNERADLALRVFVNRIVKYIGAYATELGELDAIVFTGGIGENIPRVRKLICDKLGIFGVKIDNALNEVKAKETKISAMNSNVEVWTIPTNEELMIAEDVEKLYNEKR